MISERTLFTLSDDSPLITVGDIRRLEEELANASEAAALATKRVEALRERLNSIKRLIDVLGIVGGDFQTSLSLPAASFKHKKISKAVNAARSTYTNEIRRVLEADDSGFLSYPDIKAEVKRGPLGEDFVEKSFHGALAKLEVAGEIVRYNEHAFLTAAYKTFKEAVARGDAEDVRPQSAGRQSPLTDAFQAFLNENARTKSLSASEIIEGVGQATPHFAASLRKAPNGGYNILRRLVDRGVLVKDEVMKTYRLADQQPEKEIGPVPSETGPSEEGSSSSINGSHAPSGVGL